MRRKGGAPSGFLSALVIGLIVTLVTIPIVLSQTSIASSQTELSKSLNRLDELESHLNQVCKDAVKQESDGYVAREYDFENIIEVKIEDDSLVARLDKGGSERVSLKEDCRYSWSGIEPKNTKWVVNISSDYSSGPEVDVEADKK